MLSLDCCLNIAKFIRLNSLKYYIPKKGDCSYYNTITPVVAYKNSNNIIFMENVIKLFQFWYIDIK